MAIEISSGLFTVQNLWKTSFCSTIAILCFKLASTKDNTLIYKEGVPYFYEGAYSVGIRDELPLFVLLGILCGILGSLYIQL